MGKKPVPESSEEPMSSAEEASQEEASQEAESSAERLPTMEGPNDQQACTDPLFLLLFIVFWFGMIFVGIMAFTNGDPDRLLFGTDMYGNQCGKKNDISGVLAHDLTDKPVLVFPNPSTTEISYCAKECPKKVVDSYLNVDITQADNLLCYYVTDDGEWVQPTPVNDWSNDNVWPTAFVAECYPSYSTTLAVGRCIPDDKNVDVNSTLEHTGVQDDLNSASEIGDAMAEDIYRAKWLILGAAGAALVIAFLWLAVLKLFAGFFVWGTIILVFVLLTACTIFLGVSWDNQKTSNDDKEASGEAVADAHKDNETTLLVFFIIFAILWLFYVCLILWFRKGINLAIDIMKEAANALEYMWTLIFYPLVPFGLLCVFFVWWIVVYFYLYTAGDTVVLPDSAVDSSTYNATAANAKLATYEPDNVIRGLTYYHVFGFFWTSMFLLGCTQMTIATTIAMWFYAPKKTKAGENGTVEHTSEPANDMGYPVLKSMWYTFRYHLGSIAFGSLIIAICQFLSFMINQMKHQLGRDNDFFKKLLSILDYCIQCLERFLKFVSKNAYIIIAIEGDNISFCKAMKEAFFLLVENASNLTAITFVSTFLSFLGKLFICGLTSGIFLFIIRQDEEYNFWIVPFILIVFITYFIASAFMELYDMTIDTIFICVCRDMKASEQGNLKFQTANWTPHHVDEYIRKIKADPKAAQYNNNLTAVEKAQLAEQVDPKDPKAKK